MATPHSQPASTAIDAFISHASADLMIAAQVDAGLRQAGRTTWLDAEALQPGLLLRETLQDSIGRCRVLVLLWSASAAQSRWVQAEWLTAFHLDRFIIPCTLDVTPLPQCLRASVFLPLSRVVDPTSHERVARAVLRAPAGRNAVPRPVRAASADLHDTIVDLAQRQDAMTTALGRRRLDVAQAEQGELDRRTAHAVARWPLDPMIVKLDGYHQKNAYLLEHWDAVQAGRGPADDPHLRRAEQRFFEALALDPMDAEGLNGLGSTLLLERELDAAAFFVDTALAISRAAGRDYPAAEYDRAQIHRLRGH